MTAILNSRTLLAGAAAALFVGLAMASSAQAGVTAKLLQCKGGSRDAAVACCQEVVNTYGAPGWLGGRDNCNRSVTCGKWSQNYKCHVVIYDLPRIKESKQPHEENTRNGRPGGNNPTKR